LLQSRILAELTDETWKPEHAENPKISYPASASSAPQRTRIRAQTEKDRQDVMDIFVREQLASVRS